MSLIRKSFDVINKKLLPYEILWRKKEAFSDGVTSKEKSWYQYIQEHINTFISDDEFMKIRNKLENNMVENTASIEGIAESLADNHVYFGSTNRINTEKDLFMTVTKEDIQRVAQKYLTQNSRVILHYLPKEK